MPIASLNNKELYYKEYGKGEPLLLIAGLGSDSSSWLTIIIPLSKKYRVITFDNCGVGQSSSDNTGITIQEMTDDTVNIIRYLSLTKVNILGHSMGGMIAMDLSIRYPKMVGKLMLAATSPLVNSRNCQLFTDMVSYLKEGMEKELWFRNLFYWIFSPGFFEDKDLVDQSVNMAINYRYPQSDDSFANQVDAIINFNLEEKIPHIIHNTLVIFGDRDLLFPESEVKPIFNKLVNKKFVRISDSAHSIHIDNPEMFVDVITDFI